MTKAERLARAMLQLRADYSNADFEEADRLLRSDSFTKPVHDLLNATKSMRAPKRAIGVTNARKSTPSARDVALSRVMAKAGKSENLETFARQYIDRKIIPDGAANRVFGEFIGLDLPNKLPSRIYLLEQYINALSRMTLEDKERAIARAAELGRHESSLQLWSNVINRRGE